MTEKGNGGIAHVIRALGNSWSGLRWAMRNEAAFREEVALVVVLLPIALWLGERGVEHALLIGSLILLLLTELVNSGLEAAVDRIGEEFHPLAGRAKDLGSAAVLAALVHLGVIWGLIALPNLLARF
ncbi:diacylglycerol kinase [Thiohalorhabdus sp.]|uniref:diacylglycerol kinase n=1 Tax=Thiohalorhabdus sp. TaxID=3094134 RepID=UPI002FC354F5